MSGAHDSDALVREMLAPPFRILIGQLIRRHKSCKNDRNGGCAIAITQDTKYTEGGELVQPLFGACL